MVVLGVSPARRLPRRQSVAIGRGMARVLALLIDRLRGMFVTADGRNDFRVGQISRIQH